MRMGCMLLVVCLVWLAGVAGTQAGEDSTQKGSFIVGLRRGIDKDTAEEISEYLAQGLKDNHPFFTIKNAFSSEHHKFIIVNQVEEALLVSLLASKRESIRYIEKVLTSLPQPAPSEQKQKRDVFVEEPTVRYTSWLSKAGDQLGWGLSMLDANIRDNDYTPYASWTGAGIHLFVVDSGVQAAHPEFNTYEGSGVSRVIVQ